MKLLLTSAGITNQLIADALQGLVGKSLSDIKITDNMSDSNTGIISASEWRWCQGGVLLS